jgi:hypothetical protein
MVWYRDIRLSAQPHNRTDLRLELALTPEDAPRPLVVTWRR